MSMFYTSLLTLRTKAFDSDGDGSLSVEELAALDDASAIAILTDLAAAQSSLNGYSTEDGTQDAANNVGSIATSIEGQEGASDEGKNVIS